VYGSREGRPVWGTYLEEALVRAPRWLRTNRWEMGRVLGRANLVSVLPTLVLLFAVGAGTLVVVARALPSRAPETGERERTTALLTLVVLAVVCGYVVLLVLFYANPTGSLIKATYVLPAFPPMALLGAALLERLSAWKPALHRLLVGALVLVAVHHAPLLVTRYRLDDRGRMVPSRGEVTASDAAARVAPPPSPAKAEP
jgi:hypothetical protein